MGLIRSKNVYTYCGYVGKRSITLSTEEKSVCNGYMDHINSLNSLTRGCLWYPGCEVVVLQSTHAKKNPSSTSTFLF